MPRLIKFLDGQSVRSVDIERVHYHRWNDEEKWVVRALITGGDDWIYGSVPTEEEAQALCRKLTDEINES